MIDDTWWLALVSCITVSGLLGASGSLVFWPLGPMKVDTLEKESLRPETMSANYNFHTCCVHTIHNTKRKCPSPKKPKKKI